MQNRHLILFARAPRFGAVKTRLARDIGPLTAFRFYRNTLNDLIRRLNATPGFDLSVAVTPDEVLTDGAGPVFSNVHLVAQGRGSLGQRMARALRYFGNSPTIIVGSDIPEISSAEIDDAFAKLTDHDAVFGPAEDGGYWLIGLKQPTRQPPGFLKNVRWSTEYTLSDTLSTLPSRYKVALTAPLDDIDDGPSYMAWQTNKKTDKRRKKLGAADKRRVVS
ncbi:MAG: TIGR04282 family arsenosugar biosynthesis glycosyltransferase [Pseudomonadota bacterium]